MSLTSRLNRPVSGDSASSASRAEAHAHDLRALFGKQPLQVFARIRFVIDGENGEPG